MPIDFKIGYVRVAPKLNSIIFSFSNCYAVDIYNSRVNHDNRICNLFKIDSKSGFISTNSSNFESFRRVYFILKVKAVDCAGREKIIDLKVYIANQVEKSRFVFKRLPQNEIKIYFFELRK
jgi:hypothetical protein